MQNTHRTILNVSELNADVNLLLKQGFPLLWVEGEISNFSCPASGHFYFSLKDSSAQIRCAMFKNRNRHLDLTAKNGVKVLVRGRVGLYEARGEFQLIAEHMEAAGAGLLQQQFDTLKTKLAAKSWFDPFLKKKLPTFPQQIGIISSPTGAALQDILTVLKRRCPQIPVLIYPAMAQGDKAAITLEAAVRQANLDKTCDVIIISRGGGSIEDLAAFNDENLAQALYEMEIPIIAGIGHETDFTIADFIADQRAPTPSAAAELASPDHIQLQNNLHRLTQRLQNAIILTLQQKNDAVDGLKKRLAQQAPSYQVQQNTQRLDDLKRRLKQSMQQQLTHKNNAVTLLNKQLQHHTPLRLIATQQHALTQSISQLHYTIKTTLHNKQADFAVQLAKLDAISPLKTLERGYAIVQDQQTHHIIRSVTQLKTGSLIKTNLKDGTFSSKVIRLDNK